MSSSRWSRTLLAIALLFACVGAKSHPDTPQSPPDTTGMSAATTQMQDVMKAMRESMPGAKFGRLECRKGDAWVAMSTTPVQLNSSMGGATGVVKMMVGLGRPKETFVVPGSASDVVLTESQPHFRYTGEKGDAMSLQIAVFAVDGEQRMTPIDPAKQVRFFKKAIDLKAEKVSDHVWELTPAKPLEPGQYGIANSLMGPVVDFAIADH
ncbi:MAG: hypothetical protein ACHQ52_07140 [Candidatus Eisenbacteria bacterium]